MKSGSNIVPDHFADVGKMIELAKGAQREIEDIALTRYGCFSYSSKTKGEEQGLR